MRQPNLQRRQMVQLLPLPFWLALRRRKSREMKYLRTAGFFCDPYSAAFRERERHRLADVDGPQAEAIARHVGWKFSDTEPPVCVMAVPAGSRDCVAVGWASPTSLGVNLTYAVAQGVQGQGLAKRVTSLALLELAASEGGLPPCGLVHAQFDIANLASAAVAHALGLSTNPALELRCMLPGGSTRHFLGACGFTARVLELARTIAGQAEVWPLASEQLACTPVPSRRSAWASL